ncbi:MAG: ThuA domain-containing protein [Alphaproteobacteria bacterium]|nr:ThuA domain-containing protein [Alphaproteobacteria bacterium]MBU2379569.1 ThuA domain-containing protein [Alphaproteobacteria bacterium]
MLAVAVIGLATASAAQDRPVRVLYLSQSVGFVHETVRRPPDGLAPSETAILQMARDSGAFTVELSQDAREITADRLDDLDVLVFSTTGALPIDQETWSAVIAWIESGRGGFVGIHSAADTALAFDGGEAAYVDLVGGKFDGHPWTEGTPIRLTNLEPDHPLAAMWPDGTDYAEEIYQYAGFDPDRVRVLQTLDMSAGSLRRPYPVPVTWVRQVGQGRLFYTNLGHTPSTWSDPRFRAQIVEAVRWTGRRTEAETEPNRAVQDQAALAAFAASQTPQMTVGTDVEAADDIRALQRIHPDQGPEEAARMTEAVGRIQARMR